MKNTSSSYGLLTKIFHWVLFIMLTIAVIAGNVVHSMPKGDEKMEMLGQHKAFGVLILTLVLLRFLWRLINTKPDHIPGVSAAQAFLSDVMHWGLYVLMLAQPLSGLLMSQSAGYPISFFGLGTVPTIIGENEQLADFFHEAHEIIWVLLVVAVVGHIAAALHHHFIIKNDTLKRMTHG